jgi:hypothetical protein
MLQATRKSLNKANVDKPFLGPVTSHIPLAYIRRVYEHGGLEVVDGVSIHPYRTGVGRPEQTGYVQQLDHLRRMFAEMGKPNAKIWVTENGWIHSDLPGVPPVRGVPVRRNADQVANYIIRMFTIGLSRGLDKQIYFLWNDGNMEFFGLTRGDNLHSPKKSLLGLNTLAAMLNPASFVEVIHEQMPVYAYRFRANDEDIIVAWSAQGQSSVLLSNEEDVHLYDRFGRERIADKHVVLSEAPVFIRCDRRQGLTIQPVFELTQQCPTFVRGQSLPITLHWQISPENINYMTCQTGNGLQSATVSDFRMQGSAIHAEVTIPSQTPPTQGMIGLTMRTAGQTYHHTLPVRIMSAAAATSPLMLGQKPDDWSTNSATGLEAVEYLQPGHVQFTVNGSNTLYNSLWAVLAVKNENADFSRYRYLSFDIKVLEPSDDLFMGVQLKANDGQKFHSYLPFDVMADKAGWKTLIIPLDSFVTSGLYSKFNPQVPVPLNRIDVAQITVGGSYPKAHCRFAIRRLRLEP